MSTIGVLRICIAIYLLVVVIDWIRLRSNKRLFLELLALVLMVVVDMLVASEKEGYLAFGPGNSTVITVLIMFGAIVLGIAARYIFYLKTKFSGLEFVKPLCISPILLLPLIGSIQGSTSLQPMQIVSFALLAFQNGFFWQVVLERAQPKP